MKQQDDFDDFRVSNKQQPAVGAQGAQISRPKKEDDTSLVDDLLKDVGGQSEGRS